MKASAQRSPRVEAKEGATASPPVRVRRSLAASPDEVGVGADEMLAGWATRPVEASATAGTGYGDLIAAARASLAACRAAPR